MTGVYCVFCRTGFEAGIESRLKRRGYATLVPKIKKFKPSGGKLVEKELCLLPGYVFFETDEPALDVRSINTLQNAIKLLQYDDGEYRLRGADLDFVEWIRRHAGTIEPTKVIKEGTKIRFVEGPLCELNGRVLKVNKSRRQVQIELNNADGLLCTIWCAIEYVEPEQPIE